MKKGEAKEIYAELEYLEILKKCLCENESAKIQFLKVIKLVQDVNEGRAIRYYDLIRTVKTDTVKNLLVLDKMCELISESVLMDIDNLKEKLSGNNIGVDGDVITAKNFFVSQSNFSKEQLED